MTGYDDFMKMIRNYYIYGNRLVCDLFWFVEFLFQTLYPADKSLESWHDSDDADGLPISRCPPMFLK